MNSQNWISLLGFFATISPVLLFSIIGGSMLVGYKISESAIGRWVKATIGIAFLSTFAILCIMLTNGSFRESVDFGNLVTIQEVHFHFHLSFLFDRLSIPMAILSMVLCGTVGTFGIKYLHRDKGFHRFFLCFAMFTVGMNFASLAGTIETLFLGWEFVGLSSALLVAYFHERVDPVQNGLRVWIVYRLADAAFLAAAVVLHHQTGEGNFEVLLGSSVWPEGTAAVKGNYAILAGLLLLVAAAGKSGLVPFSGWLPRAMEGPTPSSAIFYGALSVHLGAFLLLRVSPIIHESIVLEAAVISLGLITAIFASITGRVQTDVKSALAFASLAQVGIIVVEIGAGFLYLALIHLIGHACMRSLQLLRAPTLLRDYKTLENAIGGTLDHRAPLWISKLSPDLQLRIYRAAMERGYFDVILYRLIATPFLSVFRKCTQWEAAWTRWLAGEPPATRLIETVVNREINQNNLASPHSTPLSTEPLGANK